MENTNTKKYKMAEKIVEYSPKILDKSLFVLAYSAAAGVCALSLILMLLLAEIMAKAVIGIGSVSSESMIIVVYVAMYGVCLYGWFENLKKGTDFIFNIFPTVQQYREERAVERAKKNCPCFSCPVNCKGEENV